MKIAKKNAFLRLTKEFRHFKSVDERIITMSYKQKDFLEGIKRKEAQQYIVPPNFSQADNKKAVDAGLYFALSYRIKYNPEMIAGVIFGKQRLGKTMYAMQVGFDLYRDWDVVLNHTKFQLKDVLGTINDAVKNNYVIPYLIWDDAGVHGNKYMYFTNKKLAMLLQMLFDVVGTAVKGFFITTPNPGNLLKAIREYEFYRVKITKADSSTGRVATGYENIMLPSGIHNIKTIYQDRYKVTIPQPIYERYIKTRKDYLKDAVTNIDTFLAEMERDDGNDDSGIHEQIDREIDYGIKQIHKTREYIEDRLND